MTLSDVVGLCLTGAAAVAIAVAISAVTGWSVQDILIWPFAVAVALYVLFVGGSLALGLALIASPLVAVYFGVTAILPAVARATFAMAVAAVSLLLGLHSASGEALTDLLQHMSLVALSGALAGVAVGLLQERARSRASQLAIKSAFHESLPTYEIAIGKIVLGFIVGLLVGSIAAAGGFNGPFSWLAGSDVRAQEAFLSMGGAAAIGVFGPGGAGSGGFGADGGLGIVAWLVLAAIGMIAAHMTMGALVGAIIGGIQGALFGALKATSFGIMKAVVTVGGAIDVRSGPIASGIRQGIVTGAITGGVVGVVNALFTLPTLTN